MSSRCASARSVLMGVLARRQSSSSASPAAYALPALAETFREKGFISGFKVLDEDEMSDVRHKVDLLESTRPGGRFLRQDDNLHFQYRFLADLATNDTLLDCVARLLGQEDLVLMSTSVFCKYPARESAGPKPFVGWHQDLKYWNIKSTAGDDERVKVATVWLAVDAAGEDNGSMRFIPGSHVSGFLDHVVKGRADSGGNILQEGQDMELTAEQEAAAFTTVLRPGECSIHDGMLIHGSPPNAGNRRRCGLTVQFVTPGAVLGPMGYESEEYEFRKPVLVRGRDDVGAIKYVKTREQMMEEADAVL